MTRRANLVAGALLVCLAFGGTSSSQAVLGFEAQASPLHTLSVSGSGLGMYPEFAPGIDRYGLTTTTASDGTVIVSATTDDPAGRVWVNGRPAAGGTATLTGLVAGDEISVMIEDSAGLERHSLYYLPAEFPAFDAVVNSSAVAPGKVFIAPTKWFAGDKYFLAIVDRLGVPAWASGYPTGTNDFRRQPNGHYTVAQPTTTPGRSGNHIVEFDQSFRQVATHETVGLVDTDMHDSILLPDGHIVLLAYEPNAATGKTDSVIQEQDGDARIVFEWTSSSLAAQTVRLNTYADYAHVNSVVVSHDGRDFIASFRHLSSVLRIARVAHDGFQPGDIVWKLGGRESDFTFVDDPYPGGPCAQHTASELPNGHILLYDNGSDAFSTPMCINPADPSGPPITRPSTRVSEYALDPVARTATLVWSYDPARYGWFAGSAQRLPNGNTVLGWATGAQAIADEVSPTGQVVWRLTDRNATSPNYTYRAMVFDAPDVIAPEVTVASPAPGVAVPFQSSATLDFSCTDKGGSSLATCGAEGQWGRLLDTAWPGLRSVAIPATDGAGNITTTTVTYAVSPPGHLADLAIRPSSTGVFTGAGTAQPPQAITQRLAKVGASATAYVRVYNRGATREPLMVKGTKGTAAVRVRYFAGTTDITSAVVSGAYKTRSLPTDGSALLRIVATRLAPAVRGSALVVSVTGTAGGAADTVSDKVTIG